MSPPGSQYHVAEQVLGEPLLYISAREHGSIRSLLVFCIHAMLSPVFWIHGQPVISADGEPAPIHIGSWVCLQVSFLNHYWLFRCKAHSFKLSCCDGDGMTYKMGKYLLPLFCREQSINCPWLFPGNKKYAPLKDSENKGNIHGPGSKWSQIYKALFPRLHT